MIDGTIGHFESWTVMPAKHGWTWMACYGQHRSNGTRDTEERAERAAQEWLSMARHNSEVSARANGELR